MSSYTKEQYETLAVQLSDRGYHRYTDRRPSDLYDWSFAKNVKDDEGELMYQIAFIVYDRDKWPAKDLAIDKYPFGVEVKIYVSHACEPHLWERQYTVDEIETAAAEFHQLCTKLKLNIDPE